MKKPIRPMLPKLLAPLVACWGGIVYASELVYQGAMVSPLMPFLGAAALIAILVIMPKASAHRSATCAGKKLLPLLLLTTVALLLGFGSGTVFYRQLSEQAKRCGELRGELELIVIEDTNSYAYSSGSEALVKQADGSRIRVRIFWNDTSITIPRGSHLRVKAVFAPPRDDQRWMFDRGCAGTLSITVVENQGFSRDLWGAVYTFRHDNATRIQGIKSRGDGSALLAGILLGNRETLQDTPVIQDFATCGLGHLIAVSGTHLAVVAALLSWCLRKLPLGRVSEVIIFLAVLILYVMLTGLQPSAIRSAIMAGVAGCSVFIGRRGHAPSALAAAALVMLLLHPANAYSLGFWLSVSAVMGITIFTNLVAHWICVIAPFGARKKPGALSQALALTVTAMAATLPLVLSTFAVLSLISPLANLIAVPLISFALGAGMVAIVLIPMIPPLGGILLTAAVFISDICTSVSAQLAHIPWASMPLELSFPVAAVLGVGGALLVYGIWPAPAARTLRVATTATLMIICLLVQLSPYFISPRLVAMDIGQGDALLIQERGTTILIDTGASDTALVHALARNNVHRIQAIIITHLDSDHAGALGRLRGLVQVDRIYFARGLLEYQQDNEYIREAYAIAGEGGVAELSSGERLRLGDTLSLLVLWPIHRAYEGSNEESICVLLQYDENRDGIPEQQALLTGDAESEVVSMLLGHYPGLQADILKVGHHGSRKSLASGQPESLGTSVALISVGAHNRYSHPAPAILGILEASEARTFRTDEQGDISCLFRGTTLELRYATMTGEPF